MPDSAFYVITYGGPILLGSILGALLLRRAARSTRQTLGRVWIALWFGTSLFTVAAGVVAGRLYSYMSLREPPDPLLPLRPGLIMLVLMAVQGIIGWVFLRTLGEE
jgi:hypothetical protein